MPTLEERFPPGIFLFFRGGGYNGILHFNFCRIGTIGFLQGHFLRRKNSGKNFFAMPTFRGSLFEVDFLGKKICDKLSGLYSKKTRGTGGGGGSGGSIGEYLGGYTRLINEKPGGIVAFIPRAHPCSTHPQ